MIRQLLSIDPAQLNMALRILFRKKLLLDYSPITKVRSASSIAINVKCNDLILSDIINHNFKKSIMIRK
jgi:hypothetical protein